MGEGETNSLLIPRYLLEQLDAVVGMLSTPYREATRLDALEWLLQGTGFRPVTGRTIFDWWMHLVQPYVPGKKPYVSEYLTGIIELSFQALEPPRIREVFRALPRLRGLTHSKGFGLVSLFKPDETGIRIVAVARGRYRSWTKPKATDRETLDIHDVIYEGAEPIDWLQPPLLDSRGIYTRAHRHTKAFTERLTGVAPHEARFVRDFIMPRKTSAAFFEKHMRGIFNAFRINPDSWLT